MNDSVGENGKLKRPTIEENSKDIDDYNITKQIEFAKLYERKRGRKIILDIGDEEDSHEKLPENDKGIEQSGEHIGKESVSIENGDEITHKDQSFTKKDGEFTQKDNEALSKRSESGEHLGRKRAYFEEDEENERKTRRRKGGESDNVELINKTKKKVVESTPSKVDNVRKTNNNNKKNKTPLFSKKIAQNNQDDVQEKSKKRSVVYDENGIKIDSNMCHQCQRNDKGRVVRCTKCKTKRYCIPCIGNWSVFLRCSCCLSFCLS